MKKPFLFSIAAITAVGFCLWISLPFIVERIARSELQKMGFDTVNMTAPRIGFQGGMIEQAELHQDTEQITARDISISWRGLNPMNISSVTIGVLSLSLYLSDTDRLFGMDLNLPQSESATTDVNWPDIHIETTRLNLHYDALAFETEISNLNLTRQHGGEYNIEADIGIDDTDIQGGASLKGQLHSMEDYNLTLNLNGLSADVEHPLPIGAKRVNGWINAIRSAEDTQPVLSSEITYGVLIVGGASFQAVTSTLAETESGKYNLSLSGYGAERAARISIFMTADTKLPEFAGNIDIQAEDLAAANLHLEDYQLPDISGAMTLRTDFALRADPLKSWTDYTGWTGNLDLTSTFENLNYNDIKNLNAEVKAKIDLETRQMKIESDFSMAGPSKTSGKTLFDITADETLKNFTLDGAIENLTTPIARLTDTTKLQAEYSLENKRADFTLSEVRLTPSGEYRQYPAVQANLSGYYTDKLYFTLAATDIAKAVKIDADGSYTPPDNVLDMRYQAALPQGLTPRVINILVPGHNMYLENISGNISLSGQGRYQDGTFIAAQDIKLENLTGMVNTFSVQGVNGVLKLRLTPEVSLENQEIFIGGIDAAGLPLQEGLIRFDYEGNTQSLRINTMNWSLAGGRVSAEPFTMDIANMNAEFTLIAENLALPQLFQLAPMEGLDATGTVNGRIPVSVRESTISVSGAELSADSDGVIRYDPAEMPGFLRSDNEYIAILREALKNYNYDSLSLSLSGEAGKEQNVVLSATGSNPDFYDGRPVNLNLNLEGALDNILKFNLGTYSIPDRIQKQLENFEARQ